MKKKTYQKRQQLTSGFTQAGVYSRRQFCGNLEVCRSPEPLWNPRLREAATTLRASGESVVERVSSRKESVTRQRSEKLSMN